MSGPNFVLVYQIDISDLYRMLAIAVFLAFVVVGALCAAFVKVAFGKEGNRWYSMVLAAIVVYVIGAFVPLLRSYIENINLVSSKRFSYVEGAVTNFVPMPYNGHADESFTVNGVSFSYTDYSFVPGFHNTASHGGPIREGLYVHIWHIGNEITKLEIRR
jgi:hypothetical protein